MSPGNANSITSLLAIGQACVMANSAALDAIKPSLVAGLKNFRADGHGPPKSIWEFYDRFA